MRHISLRRITCGNCGLKYTAPQSVNSIADEFKTVRIFSMLTPKQVIDHDTKQKKTLTTQQLRQAKESAQKKAEELLEFHKSFSPKNTLTLEKTNETDEKTEYAVMREMKEGVIQWNNTSLQDSNNMKILCPECNHVGYEVQWH